jgi:dsRNA-specific ribonuclease
VTHKSFAGSKGDGGNIEEKGKEKEKSTDDPEVQGREGAPRHVAEGSYERLEFLGDCLLKFITSVHLYFTAPTDVREVCVRVCRVSCMCDAWCVCALGALYQPTTAGHADRPAFDAGA